MGRPVLDGHPAHRRGQRHAAWPRPSSPAGTEPENNQWALAEHAEFVAPGVLADGDNPRRVLAPRPGQCHGQPRPGPGVPDLSRGVLLERGNVLFDGPISEAVSRLRSSLPLAARQPLVWRQVLRPCHQA